VDKKCLIVVVCLLPLKMEIDGQAKTGCFKSSQVKSSQVDGTGKLEAGSWAGKRARSRCF
jgi:hypothetical protein